MLIRRKIATISITKQSLTSWTQETIRNILTNPTYAGNMTQNRYTTVSYKVKKLRAVPKALRITVKNTHEPIIDQETFDWVQQLAAKNANDNHSTSRLTYYLAGLDILSRLWRTDDLH